MPLPFDRTATIQKQGAPIATDVPCSPIWPAGDPRETPVGESYDYFAEVPAAAATHLPRGANREIIIDGRRLKVVAAEPMQFVPHVALKLREML